METNLNPIQQTILTFIRGYSRQHGRAPSIREIMDACGISSTSETSKRLDELQAAGFITRDRFKARSIRVAGEPTLVELLTDVWEAMGPEAQRLIELHRPRLAARVREVVG